MRPDDADRCSDCYEWREDKGGFGWIWFRICSMYCDHAHHRDEVWLT